MIWVKIYKLIDGLEEYKYSYNPETCEVRNDRTKRILRVQTNNDGYEYNQIYSHQRYVIVYFHVLSCIYYHGKRPEGKLYSGKPLYTVNHKDGIKTNNTQNNLEWVTYSEQMFHAHSNGLIDHSRLHLNFH